MKAEEIRENASRIKNTYADDIQRCQAWALHEIAAQLAELNETLKAEKEMPLTAGEWRDRLEKLLNKQLAAGRLEELTSTKPAQCNCREGMGKCISCRIGKQ